MTITIILRDRDSRKTIAVRRAAEHSTRLTRHLAAKHTADSLQLDRFAQYDIEVVERDEQGIKDVYDLRQFP